jgi:hypothetical protein
MMETAACNMEPWKYSEDQLRDFMMRAAQDVATMEAALGWGVEERKHGIPVEVLEEEDPQLILRFVRPLFCHTTQGKVYIPVGTVSWGWESIGMPGIDINGDMALASAVSYYVIKILSGNSILDLRSVSSDKLEIIENLKEPS